MRRAVILSLLILSAGVWFRPHLSNAGSPRPSDGFDLTPPIVAPGGAPRTIVPSSQPTTQPSPYKQVRGTDGFWRVAQTHGGVWWFLSPANEPEFLNTVTTVQPFQTGRDKEGPAFLSTDYDGGLSYDGSLDAWATKTLARVKAAGFKGLGAWSHPVFHKTDVPITRDLNVWAWMHGPARRFYSPEFAAIADQAIRTQVEPLRQNPNLVGYFIDNELDWGDAASGPGVYFDHLAPADPNRAEVVRVIQSVWATIEQFNQDWKLKVRDWKELDAWTTLPRQPQHAYARLFSAWLGHLAQDYFRLTTTLIHQYDPNHLILGVRFKGWAMREVVQASRGYTDVVSLNYYPADAKLDPEMFRMMHEVSGQPIMLSEYSFHALDGRSGNRNTVGFYAQVLDQQARADGYRLMTTRLARVPYVVGADWFQWNDEPPSGRSNDGEDANFGIVDIDDQPYERLVDAIRATTPLLNALHEKSPADAGQDIWRETFADKPVARVPYLTRPIRLNGQLSDWPREAKLQGIRHSPTVGLERSKLPLPNVYLGWRDEGLYLGVEVFDNDIIGAPAQGWWWTRDHFEFWVSTKPVASDQNAYDPHAHQFFFVPNSFPGEDGVAGTVGRLKREGDGLKESLIPHPDARHVTRVFPDRYVVEIFIPNKALTGYDPKKQNALAFNIHFRNFQHALDYFWSAPKDVLTQLRPNTWGPVYLEPSATNVRSIEPAKPAPALAATTTRPSPTATARLD